MQANHSNRQLALWLAALFVTILGAKLWVIQIFGTNVPFFDQWDEARMFFKPWLEGQLSWGDWFAPHNEHRIFFTRALDWLEIRLNRQWDPRLQMVVNAIIHAAYAVSFAFCVWFFTGKKNIRRICFVLAPIFGLPFAAENTIHGFQSQMYFLEIFSLAAMLGLGFGRAGGGIWLAGLLAAAAAIFTMASGFLAAVAVVGLIICRCAKLRRCERNDLITTAAALLVVGLGLALNVAVDDRRFQAKSIAAFLSALAGNLAWPFANQPWLLLLTCLPLALVTVEYFRGGPKDSRLAEFVLLLAGWGFLQAGALAYGRAGLSGCSRYFDTLSVLTIANFIGIFLLRESAALPQESARIRRWMVVVWTGSMLFGLWQVSQTTRADYLQWSRAWGLLEEKNVRAFLATADASHLKNKPDLAVPYGNPDRLMELLRDKHMLAIMPPDCRMPLQMENSSPSDGSFIEDGFAPEKPKQCFTQTRGSFTTNGSLATGTFRSAPLQSDFPRLILPVCCGDSLSGLRISVLAANGTQIELHPRVAGRWHNIIFAPPTGPFRLKVTDENPHSWIAFGEIKEAGIFSVAALRLANLAALVLLAGLAGFVFLSLRNLLRPQRDWPELLMFIAAVTIFGGIWFARDFDTSAETAKLQTSFAAEAATGGDMRLAQLHLREVLWAQPDNPEVLCTLGNLTLVGSELPGVEARKQAAAYYQAALKLHPHLPAAEAGLRRVTTEK